MSVRGGEKARLGKSESNEWPVIRGKEDAFAASVGWLRRGTRLGVLVKATRYFWGFKGVMWDCTL